MGEQSIRNVVFDLGGVLLSVRRVACVKGVERDRLGRATSNDGEVGALESMGLEHLDQLLVGRRGLRHDHHPAGVLVEPMDNPRTLLSGDAHQVATVMDQCVHECACRVNGVI